MCEEFPAFTPVTAYQAAFELPPGTLEQIIEARSFARAVSMVEGATTPDAVKGLPVSTLIEWAKEFEEDAAIEEMRAAERDAGLRE